MSTSSVSLDEVCAALLRGEPLNSGYVLTACGSTALFGAALGAAAVALYRHERILG